MYRTMIFLCIVTLLLPACSAANAPDPTPTPLQPKTVAGEEQSPTEAPPTPTAIPPTATPIPLTRPTAGRYNLVYVPEMKQIVMVGTKPVNTDVWAYDAVNDKLTRLKDKPASTIQCIDYNLMAKGVVTNNQNTGASWFFDPVKGEWRELARSQSYSTEMPCAIAYSTVLDKQVVLSRGDCVSSSGSGDCGYESATLLYDYSSNSWTNLDTNPSPPELCGVGIAYDRESDRILQWDGAVKKRLWALDMKAKAWEELAAVKGPSAGGAGVAMVYVPDLDRTFVYFNDEFYAYDYNTNSWEQAKGELKPGSRILQSMAYDPASKRIVLYGGMNDAGIELNDLWLYDPQSGEWVQRQGNK